MNAKHAAAWLAGAVAAAVVGYYVARWLDKQAKPCGCQS